MRLSIRSWRGGGANDQAGQTEHFILWTPGKPRHLSKDQWESLEELVELLGVSSSDVTNLRILKSFKFLGYFQHMEKMC